MLGWLIARTCPLPSGSMIHVNLKRNEDHSQEWTEAALRLVVPDFLAHAPLVDTEDCLNRNIAVDSTIAWCWVDCKGVTFGALIVRL